MILLRDGRKAEGEWGDGVLESLLGRDRKGVEEQGHCEGRRALYAER